jgi:hypothetical protein
VTVSTRRWWSVSVRVVEGPPPSVLAAGWHGPRQDRQLAQTKLSGELLA